MQELLKLLQELDKRANLCNEEIGCLDNEILKLFIKQREMKYKECLK